MVWKYVKMSYSKKDLLKSKSTLHYILYSIKKLMRLQKEYINLIEIVME